MAHLFERPDIIFPIECMHNDGVLRIRVGNVSQVLPRERWLAALYFGILDSLDTGKITLNALLKDFPIAGPIVKILLSEEICTTPLYPNQWEWIRPVFDGPFQQLCNGDTMPPTLSEVNLCLEKYLENRFFGLFTCVVTTETMFPDHINNTRDYTSLVICLLITFLLFFAIGSFWKGG